MAYTLKIVKNIKQDIKIKCECSKCLCNTCGRNSIDQNDYENIETKEMLSFACGKCECDCSGKATTKCSGYLAREYGGCIYTTKSNGGN